MNLLISSLDDMRQHLGEVTHVLSVIDPEDKEFLPNMRVPVGQHLVLFCHDVYSRSDARERERAMPGSRCIAPTEAMVQKALEFGYALPNDAMLLVHCSQGISRSPAVAYAVLCQAQPDLTESEVLRQVLKIRPQACPNRLIVAHADALLGREGQMSRALQSA